MHNVWWKIGGELTALINFRLPKPVVNNADHIQMYFVHSLSSSIFTYNDLKIFYTNKMNIITELDSLLEKLQQHRDDLQEEINQLPMSDTAWDGFHEQVMANLDDTINAFEEYINNFEDSSITDN